MTFGFTVSGDSGVQIDANYQNLGLVLQGTTPLLSLTNYNVVYTGTAASTPVIAIYVAAAARASVMSVSRAGNTWTWNIDVHYTPGTGTGGFDNSNGTSVAQPSATVDYYVFDKLAAAASSGWGIAVYDASGQPVYDHLQKPMRIAGVLTTSSQVGRTSTSFFNPTVWTGSAGRKYALVFGGARSRYHIYLAGQYVQAYCVDAVYMSGANVTVGDMMMYFSIQGSGTTRCDLYNPQPTSNLILDVTGY